MTDDPEADLCNRCPKIARTLQHLIKTEGLDSAYLWLGEVAATNPEGPEFSKPGDVIHET